MWWLTGIFSMGFGIVVTLLMLASSVATAPSRGRVGVFFVRLFAIMLCVEVFCFCCAVAFVILAETGTI